MPRILPRLLKVLENASLKPQSASNSLKRPIWRKKSRSLWRPLPSIPDWTGPERTQSVLADRLNPLINKRRFRRHKTLPPRARSEDLPANKSEGFDKWREMTDEEREWYASPYLRMLGTSIRKCALTGLRLPRDFLVRLAPMQVPGPRGSKQGQYILPSGVENPRFKSHTAGHGIYVLCRGDVVDRMLKQPGSYKRYGNNMFLHGRLAQQIGHLLRLRVLQEMELLTARLRCARRTDEMPVPLLKRLTRSELKQIKDTGVIPYPSAVALLIVPPLNKDPTTKERPVPNKTGLPDPDETRTPVRSVPPLSELLHTSESTTENEDSDWTSTLPPSKVPLYNGVTLFPSRPQRAALYTALHQLLFVEHRARQHKLGKPDNDRDGLTSADDDASKPHAREARKMSHAYVLCSDATTLLRADAVPLAIALWRVRLWEGSCWLGTGRTFSGWKIGLPRIQNQ